MIYKVLASSAYVSSASSYHINSEKETPCHPLIPQWLLLALALGSTASAQEPALFKNADLKLGQRLIAENKCAECHARKWADDGNAVYRPKGRINTPALLQGMVERCSNELSLNLFPEEVTAIAAALNHAHYKFRDTP